MNLRLARFDDHWRHITKRRYPTRLDRIAFNSLSSLADSTIEFSSGITAIIGSNGVGKSTLVAAIAELLSNGSEVAAGHVGRLKGSTTEAMVTEEAAERRLKIENDASGKRIRSGEEFSGNFQWLDPSGLANLCLTQIHNEQNLKDLLDPVTPETLDAENLELASYVVSKRYESVQIYEISDYGGLDVFPYFRVKASGITYDSDGMGRGELALLLTYWTFQRLQAQSIVVIEEPETHVSPRSQDCLMNMIAKFSDDRAIWTIIATHSPTVIRRLSVANVKLLSREKGKSTLINNPTKVQIGAILGGGVAFKGVVLVEDAMARGFVLTIFEEIDPDMLLQFDVVVAGSESDITAAISTMPGSQKTLTLIGAYDGDMRERASEFSKLHWPSVFLPGDVPPEGLIKRMIEETEDVNDRLATALQKQAHEIGVALDSVSGADCHELIRGLASALLIDESIVRRSIAKFWLSEESNLKAAKDFLNELRKAISEIRRP